MYVPEAASTAKGKVDISPGKKVPMNKPQWPKSQKHGPRGSALQPVTAIWLKWRRTGAGF
jgi:hypothetical protein